MTAVLLTGSRAPVTLDLARRFHDAGHFVVVADSQPALTSASASVGAAYRVPPARFAPWEFARAVAGIAERHAVGLIVPTCEEVFHLAAVRDTGTVPGLRGRVFAPPLPVLRRLHDKALFASLLAELGIPHPGTTVVDSGIGWRRLARGRRERPGTAVVVKPAYSRFGALTRRVREGAPLPDVPAPTPEHPWLVQEHLDGTEFCVHAIAVGGTLTAFSAYRPVWRAGTGAGVAFERLDAHDTSATLSGAVRAAERYAEQLAGHLAITGQFGLDLIATGSGDPHVLECNPRATSGLHLFTAADDLPSAFVPADPSRNPTHPSSPSARLGIPHALYGPAGIRSGTDLRRHLRQLRFPDVLRPRRDRLPIGTLLRSLAVQAAAARASGVSLLAASTHDIEWNGEPLPEDPDRGEQMAADGTSPPAGWASRLVEGAQRAGGSEHLAPTIAVRFETVDAGGLTLPLTRPRATRPHEPHAGTAQNHTHPGAPPSYVVSPHSHFIHYAREELGALDSPVVRALAARAIDALDLVTRPARLDDIALVGNALVSTNLQPDVSEATVRALTAELTARHPRLAIGWRSVHGRGTRLPDTLRRAGYRLIPSRSVLFLPTRGTEWQGLRDSRRDRALLETSGYSVREAPRDATGASDEATRRRIADLYDLLYVDKYSSLNPRYTPEFIAVAERSGLLRFVLLERGGRIDAAFGYTIAHGLLAAPVVGYDTALPQELGLYRMLSYAIARTAHEAGVDLHASSGVAAFKRNRGADAEFECTAVYTRHLPWPRRAGWAVLDLVVRRIAVPLVQRNGL
ncbi:GNAT family N-acetyltransferase [Herbiconiux sp. CPCC 203407]|uniref:GNAT family N-acetyltransferase n=1 Tax=Herbiconiux oxytropis TaxID=2970915 RepID=A0AA42BUJ2_9MICO|nr:GNAT family N-acetyltransferase [Herbiconiux oxytropis]MCS5721315.1 GNAT family N-acetyltransferase [Herbiconiux oxytropis]MCS5726246.1 GNAT family N-acetyltransferase [Herbiconiux oxytropis]